MESIPNREEITPQDKFRELLTNGAIFKASSMEADGKIDAEFARKISEEVFVRHLISGEIEKAKAVSGSMELSVEFVEKEVQRVLVEKLKSGQVSVALKIMDKFNLPMSEEIKEAFNKKS